MGYLISIDDVRRMLEEAPSRAVASYVTTCLDNYEEQMRQEERDALSIEDIEFEVVEERESLTIEDAIFLEQQWEDYDGDYPNGYLS